MRAHLLHLPKLWANRPAQYPEPTNITHSMASTLRPLNRDRASLVSSSTRQTQPTKKKSATSKSKRSSAYDNNFKNHCIKNCIFPPDYEFPNGMPSPIPNNFQEILRIIKSRRPSLSTSAVPKTAYSDFRRKTAVLSTESDLSQNVIPLIIGDANIPHNNNLLFTNLTSITGNATASLKPDFFDGRIRKL